ncbi:efflux RND transporter periplasmic adaptor subunit [Paracoccus sp. SCSIO 75233]|uniref:efflux RND transporter periplasmic adaptor subunit n=1 Tax=Paracoccus sp. SCSIO 75233 TaxID=3017782 RepID=UPI0022F03A3A|nr:efflux RND transporter periplasmic adaptor subunit [Paracoccus sp. SCSIO 75233]WBU53156.1 efflux RND transporter periplasmic adaptor subunit [Paracoccus sp. SCSIO 75233]
MATGFCLGPAYAQPIRVEFIEAKPTQIGLDVRLTGTLEALDSVDLGFREGGRITDIFVDEGDEVRRDEVLGRIDPLQKQQAFNAARASLDAARAAEEQARQAANRAQAMLDRGVGTRAARDDARQLLSSAETRARQAQTALDQARRSLEDTELRAPFEGVVTARTGEPGQVVGAAQAILSLAASGGIEAQFLSPDLPHLDAAKDARVDLTTLEVDAPPMVGQVTEISPLVDEVSGSVRVRAVVQDAPDDVALLGAAVRGVIELSTGEAVEIPWTALSSTNGSPAVWVVDADGKAQLREVELERFDNGSVLLSGGLDANEIVVGAGSQLLYPGRRVLDGGRQ